MGSEVRAGLPGLPGAENQSPSRAVANGVKLGRKPTLTHDPRREAIRRVNALKNAWRECAII